VLAGVLVGRADEEPAGELPEVVRGARPCEEISEHLLVAVGPERRRDEVRVVE
jgi:hypothetical protein